jgi:DNA-binding MarR family transcriptional regulator
MLARASHDISRDYLHEIRARGFTARQWRLLGSLWDEKSLTLTELALVIFCSQSTTTRLVDKLVELGLIERRMDTEDRRKFHVSLTAFGRDRVRGLVALAEDIELKTLDMLGAERATRLKKDLAECIARFGSSSPDEAED